MRDSLDISICKKRFILGDFFFCITGVSRPAQEYMCEHLRDKFLSMRLCI